MYRSSQQTQFPISLSSILWPGEGSNPNLSSTVWNDSSLSAFTDPQFDEANGFPRPGESPIGSSFYVTDQQLPLSTSEILIFRNYVDNVSRWVNYILSSQIPHDEVSSLIMLWFRSTPFLEISLFTRLCLSWPSDAPF